ncbi:DUF551 domain-containing protein [Aliiroseovarius zhejiangensis]|uniref:DUF551 domain-containing protein n=1 Tax=Aliiroseovarius zhejiangensis TaxID=1632025 RepID=UPI00174C5208
MDGDDCDEPYSSQVAVWVDKVDYEYPSDTWSGAFRSETFNPCSDYAVNPTHWMPLPEPPEGSHE